MQLDLQPQPHPVPWTARDVWWGVASFAIWLVIAIGFRVGLELASAEVTLDLGLFVSLAELLLLIPVWYLAIRKYRVGWRTLGLRPFGGAMVGVGCGLMLISFAFNFIYGLFLSMFDLRIQIDLVPIFQDLSSPWLFFVGGAIIAPMVEEIFFRGFVFAGLRSQYGWQRAALLSAAIFALLHFTPTAILPIFILGYIFALLYQLSGSIWPAILMHILTNSLALGAAYLMANAEQLGLPLGLA